MMTRATKKTHAILRIIGAAALVTALMGIGAAEAATVTIVVGPAPVGSYYVTHRHFHGDDCGHYRVWNDGVWAYYYGGRWEYYTPGHKWAYYRGGHVPSGLRGHSSKAKSFRYHPGKGAAKGVVVAPRKSGHSGPVYRPGPSKPHGTIGKGRSGPGPKGMPSKGKGPGMGHGGKGGHKK